MPEETKPRLKLYHAYTVTLVDVRCGCSRR